MVPFRTLCVSGRRNVLPRWHSLVLLLAALVLVYSGFAQTPAADAALFLEQATWGPTPAEIGRVVAMGKAAYVEEQLSQPATRYPAPADNDVNLAPYQRLFFQYGVHNPDQLRQRVAFALSQIFVVSGNTLNRAHMMVPYLNLLSEGALGNYRDLLLHVSLSPAMGRYLDNVGNRKADPARGTSPNENYSREFLQLFTLGTEVLNEDGSAVRDANGKPVPVYTEETVKELARAFTGWLYAAAPGTTFNPNRTPAYYGAPMVPWDAFHDTGTKTLLDGYQMPAGRTTREDLEDAINHIFEHPNLAPFVSIRLIRSLVTSNPSPRYVRDVVAVFKNNGSGVRGDLAAVVRAILLHPEASGQMSAGGAALGAAQGHLAEPALYAIKVMRALEATVGPENNLNRYTTSMGQNVFIPPSVFSYYHLDHMMTKRGLAAPEFEIHTSATALERANFIGTLVDRRLGAGITYPVERLLAAAPNASQLVDTLSLLLTHDTLPEASKAVARTFVEGASDAAGRVARAIYLVANSPQAWVSGARAPAGGRSVSPGRRRVAPHTTEGRAQE